MRRSFVAPVPQKNGPPALVYNLKIVFPAGGPTYDGTGYVSSGVLAIPKPLTFTKPGRYEYECLIHPGMEGYITVQPAGQ